MKVDLSFHASKLKNVAGAFHGTCVANDSYLGLTSPAVVVESAD